MTANKPVVNWNHLPECVLGLLNKFHHLEEKDVTYNRIYIQHNTGGTHQGDLYYRHHHRAQPGTPSNGLLDARKQSHSRSTATRRARGQTRPVNVTVGSLAHLTVTPGFGQMLMSQVAESDYYDYNPPPMEVNDRENLRDDKYLLREKASVCHHSLL